MNAPRNEIGDALTALLDCADLLRVDVGKYSELPRRLDERLRADYDEIQRLREGFDRTFARNLELQMAIQTFESEVLRRYGQQSGR